MPPSYTGGLHANVHICLLISVTSNGPVGGPGTPVTYTIKLPDILPQSFLTVRTYLPASALTTSLMNKIMNSSKTVNFNLLEASKGSPLSVSDTSRGRSPLKYILILVLSPSGR